MATTNAPAANSAALINSAFVTGQALGRKFEVGDVTPDLLAAANAFARRYEGTFTYMLDMRYKATKWGLSPAQAKGVLNCLMAEGNKALAASNPTAAPAGTALTVEDKGVYVLPDGTIVKLQANKAKTAVYSMRWVEIGGTRLTEAGPKVKAEYQYEPALKAQVASQGRKMNLEEAKAFIVRYGVCSRCGRQLKAADSVEAGIGPVCITYFGGYGA